MILPRTVGKKSNQTGAVKVRALYQLRNVCQIEKADSYIADNIGISIIGRTIVIKVLILIILIVFIII